MHIVPPSQLLQEGHDHLRKCVLTGGSEANRSRCLPQLRKLQEWVQRRRLEARLVKVCTARSLDGVPPRCGHPAQRQQTAALAQVHHSFESKVKVGALALPWQPLSRPV